MSEDIIELGAEQQKELERQLQVLEYGSSEITPRDEFVAMLAESIRDQRPLRVKCGIDPTISDVHLGHLVPYRKMRQFQDLGHIGVVIIGDYTASIGDPTGKNESRPALDAHAIKINAQSYMQQIYTVVDRDKTEVCFQTEWFDDIGLRDVIGWAAQTTVAKLLSHETFRNRLDEGNALSLHELFYPVLQGVDSVYVKADVELGGSDQKFNVLMGRDYQKNAGLRPQVALLVPLLTGTCGSSKMSKSLGNFIAINDEPFEKFGKVMSIPDHLMIDYFTYITDTLPDIIEKYKKGLESEEIHPNELKKQLASQVVGFFHGEEVGHEMRQKFEDVFKRKKVPDDITEYCLEDGHKIVDVLFESKMVGSKGEGRRLIKQNAVGIIDGQKITDADFMLTSEHKNLVLKIGKRKFLKLV